MDSVIYALVLAPSLRDLLLRSGMAVSTQNIGIYGGLLFALFLIGWGLSFLWGPVAGRFGRVRTLTAIILCYSAIPLLRLLARFQRTFGNLACFACWRASASAASGPWGEFW